MVIWASAIPLQPGQKKKTRRGLVAASIAARKANEDRPKTPPWDDALPPTRDRVHSLSGEGRQPRRRRLAGDTGRPQTLADALDGALLELLAVGQLMRRSRRGVARGSGGIDRWRRRAQHRHAVAKQKEVAVVRHECSMLLPSRRLRNTHTWAGAKARDAAREEIQVARGRPLSTLAPSVPHLRAR